MILGFKSASELPIRLINHNLLQCAFRHPFRKVNRCQFFASKPKDTSEKDNSKSISKYEDIPLFRIRNFSIIAHVDHGKSTLADRLLEITGTLKIGDNQQQVLDRLQVERERGITVKAQTASIRYWYDNEEYLLNLIDTPGHVDFSNEVSRSLAACQGVILLVDANQGVQAQTVANFYLAFMQDLVIIPVLNKVDLKNAQPEAVANQLQSLFEIDPSEVLKISAKVGTGCEDVIKAVIQRLPPPDSDREAPLKALLFDCWYDKYRGAISLLYIKDGAIRIGDTIKSALTGSNYVVKSLGVLKPHEEETDILVGGQVGFMTCNMRTTSEACIGDTLFLKDAPVEPLTGFKPAKPMVFAGVYPLDQSQNVLLRKAIEKLTLNDSAVTVVPESSPALGQGWRLGFLGLLHLEVFSQRLEQEYDAPSIMTAPSVTYRVKISGEKNIKQYGKDILDVSNPSFWPDPSIIKEIFEPMVIGTIIFPEQFYGAVLALCMERRGKEQSTTPIDTTRLLMKFVLPLNEIIVDFHDQLKSITSGFASFDYEDNGYQSSNLVKITILLNGREVEELSTIVHITRARDVGKKMCTKLLDLLPRQMFQISIQAALGSKILAREDLKAFRKDVTAKLYGGDQSRKIKLLKRQAEGKKRMKMIGNIQIPRETFIDVLKR